MDLKVIWKTEVAGAQGEARRTIAVFVINNMDIAGPLNTVLMLGFQPSDKPANLPKRYKVQSMWLVP